MPYKAHMLTITADNGREFAHHQDSRGARYTSGVPLIYASLNVVAITLIRNNKGNIWKAFQRLVKYRSIF